MRGSSKPPEGTGDADPSLTSEEVEAQLARILASAEFSHADSHKDLLSYVVRRKLGAPERPITEYDIAYDVAGRNAGNFNPLKDSVVRHRVLRVRKSLEAYYTNGGKNDSLIIELPKGKRYEPCFRRRPDPAEPIAAEPIAAEPITTEPITTEPIAAALISPRRWPRIWWICAAAFLLSLCLLLGRSHLPHSQAVTPPNAIPTRIFASSTSEGRRLRVIGGPQRYSRLLITPDGKELYAVSAPNDESVTVFRTSDLTTERVFSLSSPVRSAFVSRDGGRIYFGSVLEGVTVVNTATGRLERTIHTGAPVLGLAVTPDNRKLFLALGNSRLARINLETLEERILSSVALPFDMGLDGSGRNLYVAYQHGGPGGRSGHDVVEVYDTSTESVSYVIKDLPMVGARPLFALRDEVVLLNMADACLSTYYDHVGCPGPPSGGFYLWNPAERRVIATVSLPNGTEVGGFLPEGTRLLLVDHELAVWDWSRKQTLEKMKLPKAGTEGGEIASLPDRVFVLNKNGGILVFDPEKPGCRPPALGLANFYSGDGTLDDAEETGKLTARGEARFAPGRIGQAFDFDGQSGPLATKIAADYCPDCRLSWTEAFFVKFRSLAGEMVLMKSPAASTNAGRRILKTNDNRIALETGGGAYPKIVLKSAIPMQAGRWYHVAVVSEGNRKSFFVDGMRQDERQVPIAEFHGDHWPAIFGADQHGRHPLRGLLDEIVVYDRALTPAEVKSLATSCPAP